jgi:hypothetical protein
VRMGEAQGVGVALGQEESLREKVEQAVGVVERKGQPVAEGEGEVEGVALAQGEEEGVRQGEGEGEGQAVEVWERVEVGEVLKEAVLHEEAVSEREKELVTEGVVLRLGVADCEALGHWVPVAQGERVGQVVGVGLRQAEAVTKVLAERLTVELGVTEGEADLHAVPVAEGVRVALRDVLCERLPLRVVHCVEEPDKVGEVEAQGELVWLRDRVRLTDAVVVLVTLRVLVWVLVPLALGQALTVPLKDELRVMEGVPEEEEHTERV